MKLKSILISCVVIIVVGLGVSYTKLSDPPLPIEHHANLRGLNSEDLARVIAIHDDCFAETNRKNLVLYLKTYRKWDDAKARTQVERILMRQAAKKNEFFKNLSNIALMRDNGTIIGMYSCTEEHQLTQGSMMINNVCLQRNRRGRGLGNRLMEDALTWCRRPGKAMTVTVYKYDTPVLNFYDRLHFKIIDHLESWGEEFNFFNKVLMEFKKEEK